MTPSFPVVCRRFEFSALMCVLATIGLSGCGPKAKAPPAQMPIVQVVAIEAKREPVTERLSLVGSFAANEMVEIKSETEGVIHEILFEEGQPVQKGQLLIRLDESKLEAAVAEASANFNLSKANFERTQQLRKNDLISQHEYDQAASMFSFNQANLELKRRQLKDARIFAEFEGITSARLVSPGQVISKNSTLTWLVDLDPLKVEFNIPERFLRQVQIGQTIEVIVDAFPERTFKGSVFFISPYVDESTRTSLIKALVPNPKHELKPGMFANLDLTLTVREQAVVISDAAVNQMLDGDRATVYIVDTNQTVQLRQVKLGVYLPGQVEVRSGLQGGELVIVEGVQKIGPGSKVKLAPPEAALPYHKPDPSIEIKKSSD